ncbi:ion transporter [Vulcaniibacterium tengchongense]|uniref:Voltage-gated potassium channel n=1 Tax=Vulcaniibacterium tengchongense TaxID=1273429 RepID=A0A3N4VPZ4_9GAMM|nr:ion transporter [Vulcaniibacterium tengchongense]RPE81959.1 voltage-gated potassium channel [Vulcaniibacterium tengchongense]
MARPDLRLGKQLRLSDRTARRLDGALLLLIVLSVLVVMLDSVESVHARHGRVLYALEWAFTGIFTVEYLLRLWAAPRPSAYARSFFGVVDLLSILPTYAAFLFPGVHVLADVRLLRLLRVFSILRLSIYLDETRMLREALVRARRKILVFVGVMFVLTVILGTVIYLVEGPENGFTSIPVGVYWAAVTMSTTGYGDLTPHTALGRLITACAILMGYGIIAFPTGIMGAELVAGALDRRAAGRERRCPHCGAAGPHAAREAHQADTA